VKSTEMKYPVISRLLEFSLRQRVFVLVAAAGLVVAGISAALRLPIDAVPDITNVQVQINTEVPALAPEESERLVTFPLETELTGVPGMDEVRSLTRFGLSQITLIFKDGTDIYRARQLVSERMQSALGKIPPGLAPKLAPITTGLSEIYQYTVDYAPAATNKPATRREQLMELKLIQDFTIKPMLRTVPGVAEVNAMGGYEKQIVVLPQPQKLRDANFTFEELAKLIGENVQNVGGGVVNHDGQQLIVRSVTRVETTGEIGDLPVKFAAGIQPILIKDVAEVCIGSKVRTGAATENGEEAVVGMAMMLSGENSRIVAKRVGERIQQIQSKLPPGVLIRTVYDRSALVDRTIGTVEKNLFEGAVLVVLVLLALLGNWRAALIVAAAIPLSFLFAMTGMVQGSLSGNLMSLGAIDFGLIIDGAVVIVENIVRRLAARQQRLARRLTSEERTHMILAASKEVASPMFLACSSSPLSICRFLRLPASKAKCFIRWPSP